MSDPLGAVLFVPEDNGEHRRYQHSIVVGTSLLDDTSPMDAVEATVVNPAGVRRRRTASGELVVETEVASSHAKVGMMCCVLAWMAAAAGAIGVLGRAPLWHGLVLLFLAVASFMLAMKLGLMTSVHLTRFHPPTPSLNPPGGRLMTATNSAIGQSDSCVRPDYTEHAVSEVQCVSTREELRADGHRYATTITLHLFSVASGNMAVPVFDGVTESPAEEAERWRAMLRPDDPSALLPGHRAAVSGPLPPNVTGGTATEVAEVAVVRYRMQRLTVLGCVGAAACFFCVVPIDVLLGLGYAACAAGLGFTLFALVCGSLPLVHVTRMQPSIAGTGPLLTCRTCVFALWASNTNRGRDPLRTLEFQLRQVQDVRYVAVRYRYKIATAADRRLLAHAKVWLHLGDGTQSVVFDGLTTSHDALSARWRRYLRPDAPEDLVERAGLLSDA